AGRGRSRGTRLPCRSRRHFPPHESGSRCNAIPSVARSCAGGAPLQWRDLRLHQRRATGVARPQQKRTDMHTIRLPYHDRYPYSPITARKDYSWPGGKRLAVYLGLNIEHFAFGAGEGHLLTVANPPPDPRTFAWRDYGNRVGVWRCLELFDELNLPAAHLINTTVFEY